MSLPHLFDKLARTESKRLGRRAKLSIKTDLTRSYERLRHMHQLVHGRDQILSIIGIGDPHRSRRISLHLVPQPEDLLHQKISDLFFGIWIIRELTRLEVEKA